MSEELAKQLIDQSTGFFQWWNREDRLDLYQTAVAWPLITTTLNGFGVPANWIQRPGLSKAETLFEVLREISPSWTGFYICNPDEAFSQVLWTKTIENPVVGLLDEFTTNAADQGGTSFLGLYLNDVENQILFTYGPGEMFRISLFGRVKELVSSGLAA